MIERVDIELEGHGASHGDSYHIIILYGLHLKCKVVLSLLEGLVGVLKLVVLFPFLEGSLSLVHHVLVKVFRQQFAGG